MELDIRKGGNVQKEKSQEPKSEEKDMPEDGIINIGEFISRKPRTAREFLQQRKVMRLRKATARIKKGAKRGN